MTGAEVTQLLTARSVAPAGTWNGEVLDDVMLDYDARFRRRIRLTGESGTELLLDLAEAVVLNNGDGLVTQQGMVRVLAAPEELVEIRCADQPQLLQVAWHLGNRHLPTELRGDSLRIRADHVIVEMVEKLGATVSPVRAPFNPEGGAYGHGRTQGHNHDRDD